MDVYHGMGANHVIYNILREESLAIIYNGVSHR